MKVFVSATSSDLAACRNAVKDVLLQADIQPVTQEVLRSDHRGLPEYLEALIQSCDAVVCLVGHVFGAAPADQPHRSYTQQEYDCAQRLGKPVFVFLAGDEFGADDRSPQSPQEAAWQEEHRQAVLAQSYCRAFDTQYELEKEIGVAVWSIHKATGRIPMQFYHLPATPPFFAGRTDEKGQLQRAMADRSPGVIAVVGMAGQGKSTLVHHVVAGRQEDTALAFQAGFWCTAGLGGFSFDMFLDEALAFLTGGTFEKSQAPRTQQRVQRLLGNLQRRPSLIVIDAVERWLCGWQAGDADQEAFADEDRLAAADGLDDFLSQATSLANGSHVVITSRAMPAALEDEDMVVIPVRTPTEYDVGLQGLAPADAVDLLKSYDLEASDDRLAELAGQLGYHPLAMRVFGGYVKKRFGGRLDQAGSLSAWDRRKTLRKLFDEVHDRLPGGAAARRFLEVVSCTIEEAPLEALQAVLAPDAHDDPAWDARELALLLADWQVIHFDSRADTVGMHALLKDHLARRLAPSDRLGIHGRFAAWYGDQPMAGTPTALADVKARILSIRHALEAEDPARCERAVWGPVTPMYCLAEWLGRFGHFVEGAALLGSVASAATGALRARALLARAALLRPLGQHETARRDLDEAIDLLDQDGGPQPADVPDLAGALSNRGTVLLELVRYSDALGDFDRAISLLSPLPQEVPVAFQLASVYANRAMVLREMGHLRRAIADCSQAIDTHRAHLEPAYRQLDSDLASALSNRGNAYLDLLCHDKALADYKAALGIYVNLVNVGQEQFRAARARGHTLVGSAQQGQEGHVEAIAQFDEAIETFRQLIHSGRRDIETMLAWALLRRGWSLSALARYEEALDNAEESCAAYDRLAQTGRRDVWGPCAYAKLATAVMRYAAGDRDRGSQDWAQAVARTV